jgi:hypothetical protein
MCVLLEDPVLGLEGLSVEYTNLNYTCETMPDIDTLTANEQ